MHKFEVAGLSDVSETLLLPLYYRARESVGPEPLLTDPKAVALVQQINYDFARFKKLVNEQFAAVVRARIIDQCAQAFLERHPDGNVVNIGCGLDTRFHRMDNGRAEWYELDLPPVIDLRARMIGPTPRTHLLGFSALDSEWMDAIENHVEACLFTAEGVLPYFAEQDVKRLICELQKRFPMGELVFDALSPFLVWVHNIELTLTNVPARLRWSLRDAKDLEKWGNGLSLIDKWYYFDQPEARMRGMRLMRHLPLLSQSASILHYRLCTT